MATVVFDERMDKYKVMRRGSVVSTHNLARQAKEKGKKVGREYGEPVSYEPKNGGATKYIYRPDPDDQFGNGSGNGDGLLGGLF